MLCFYCFVRVTSFQGSGTSCLWHKFTSNSCRRVGEVARALLCIAYQRYWFCNFGLEKWIVLRALQEQVMLR